MDTRDDNDQSNDMPPAEDDAGLARRNVDQSGMPAPESPRHESPREPESSVAPELPVVPGPPEIGEQPATDAVVAAEAADVAAPVDTEVRRCLDCGSPLDGPYCAGCGQRDVDRLVPLGELVGDLLDELAGLQTRLVRTLRMLVLRPGVLTGEYVEGRRVRYVPPPRLYLILALGFFLLVRAAARRSHRRSSRRGSSRRDCRARISQSVI
jgi:hypothetical protein